ncbi:prepilin-type N-terminal cleavage/methylation domain-containing protein [Planococcus sp. NCCP-2050]|uniref:prepilin-type N-terminal cleavage/methylation domain-containing protein n=1 Tax=Planococcus sp. NCCP-2050 TaxID=2944679 RepID=UPI00203E82AB|nr:prepilin-type N-terminal cleavage/methylation domain-containing protein [Planococcus sp. NCCP-2050]GKW46810.1 hypothetical protein NCCP2050_25020 [Planococcus sp. NCCP-2050]
MKKFIQKKLKDQKGLTLIELLAVIVIIAIIAAIAIPAIGNIIDNSRKDALISDAQNVLSAANLYFADNGEKTTVSLSELEATGGYLETSGGVTAATVTKGSPNSITFTGTAGSTTYSDVTATADSLSSQGRDLLTGGTEEE